MLEILQLHTRFGLNTGLPDTGGHDAICTIVMLLAGSAGLNQDDVLAD